jgi:hypothetical protein
MKENGGRKGDVRGVGKGGSGTSAGEVGAGGSEGRGGEDWWDKYVCDEEEGSEDVLDFADGSRCLSLCASLAGSSVSSVCVCVCVCVCARACAVCGLIDRCVYWE